VLFNKTVPHPGWFFAKSAELLENKRVEILVSAKKCKRVRKSLKRKEMSRREMKIESPKLKVESRKKR
jgi:hypothetical protein